MTDTTTTKPADMDDDALMVLYNALAERSRKDGSGTSYSDMNDDERRAYQREAVRKHRAKERAARKDEMLMPSAENVRAALADGAMRILRDGGPGSDVLLDTLKTVFDDKPGVPMTVLAKIRRGRLKPRLWRSVKLAPVFRKAIAKRKAADAAGDPS